jgi:hypothetical protein
MVIGCILILVYLKLIIINVFELIKYRYFYSFAFIIFIKPVNIGVNQK